MHDAIRLGIQVAREDPAAGALAAGDFHPRFEFARGDVRRPGEEEPPEIVIPLAAGELLLVLAPGLVGLDDVADPAEIHRAIAKLHRWIADADRLGFGILRAEWPVELAGGRPAPVGVAEGPFRVRVADVLQEDHFAALAIDGEAAIGMLGKGGGCPAIVAGAIQRAWPDRRRRNGGSGAGRGRSMYQAG